jgi:hypothetical protein
MLGHRLPKRVRVGTHARVHQRAVRVRGVKLTLEETLAHAAMVPQGREVRRGKVAGTCTST